MDYNNIDERDYEGESGPFVKEVVLPPAVYNHALHRGYQTYQEVGFYLIGLFKKGICYVYDLVEFEYSEQSGGFIESDMARFFRVKTGIPMGLRIVGHLHKHPGFTSYSTTDRQNFLRYGHSNPLNVFLIYMVEPHNKISGYTATAERIFNVTVTIRELTSEEMLMEKDLKIEFKTKVLVPQNSEDADIARIFAENIGSETLKYLSRPTIQPQEKAEAGSSKSTIEVTPRKAVEIQNVGNNKTILYRVFMEETETIADLEKVFKRLVNIPKQKGYELVFYQSGRRLPNDMAIAAINQPLAWTLETGVLQEPYAKFFKFLGKSLGLLKEQRSEKETILEPTSEKVQEAPTGIPEPQERVEGTTEHKVLTDQEKELAVLDTSKKKDTTDLPEDPSKKEEKGGSEAQEGVNKAEEDLRKKRKEARRDRLDYFI
ncbi:MAG: hypothetical protein LUQ65_13055 [Candidatus Helarchaeota archaeon]|nr:hypothetical protein [Candidatus Helarchaeota archaeon]